MMNGNSEFRSQNSEETTVQKPGVIYSAAGWHGLKQIIVARAAFYLTHQTAAVAVRWI